MAKTKGTKHHVVIKLEDLNKMFKEQVKKVEKPVLHYEMIGEYMNGILDDLDTAGVDTNAMRHNLREEGYHKKYYGFQRG